MLTEIQFRYLDRVLRDKPIWYPLESPYPLNDGHVPEHMKCHVTAVWLETTKGWGAQIGIQWLDKGGKLLPWPHVVTWRGDRLYDYSHPICETKLGFSPIGNDAAMANAITAATSDLTTEGTAITWADPRLQRLHDTWYAKLSEHHHANRSVR